MTSLNAKYTITSFHPKGANAAQSPRCGNTAGRAALGEQETIAVTTRAEILALAVDLCSREETTLGPSDSKLCVEALQHYAGAQSQSAIARALRGPALIAASALVIATVLYNSPVAGMASGEKVAATFETNLHPPALSNLPRLARNCVKPIPHTEQFELVAQAFTASYDPARVD